MLAGKDNVQVYFYSASVDMRKSIDGLSIIVSEVLQDNPGNGHLYVFYNKGLDKLKILYWSLNGYCLYYKRMDKRKFVLPDFHDKVIQISYSQLHWLLDGLDIKKIKVGYKNNHKIYC